MSGKRILQRRASGLLSVLAVASGCSAAPYEATGSGTSGDGARSVAALSAVVSAVPVESTIVSAAPAPATSSEPSCDAPPAPSSTEARALLIDSEPALNATAELPVRAVAPALLDAFPAVSDDGTRLVELTSDAEDFSGRSVERLRFYSLPSGRVESTFMLHDERADDASKSPNERARHLRELETAWSQAKTQLARSKWRSLEKGVGVTGSECEPWASAYRGDAAPLEYQRFPNADMDVALELTADGNVASLRVRRAVAGKILSTHTDITFPAVGSLFGKGDCGMITGLEASFVTPDRRTLFLFPQPSLGGDSCAATLRLDTARIVTLPTPKK